MTGNPLQYDKMNGKGLHFLTYHIIISLRFKAQKCLNSVKQQIKS